MLNTSIGSCKEQGLTHKYNNAKKMVNKNYGGVEKRRRGKVWERTLIAKSECYWLN